MFDPDSMPKAFFGYEGFYIRYYDTGFMILSVASGRWILLASQKEPTAESEWIVNLLESGKPVDSWVMESGKAAQKLMDDWIQENLQRTAAVLMDGREAETIRQRILGNDPKPIKYALVLNEQVEILAQVTAELKKRRGELGLGKTASESDDDEHIEDEDTDEDDGHESNG